jgi:hypothetical protein
VRSRAVSRSRGAPVFLAIASNRLLPKAISRTASSVHFSPIRFRAAATEQGRPGSSSRISTSLSGLRNQTDTNYARVLAAAAATAGLVSLVLVRAVKRERTLPAAADAPANAPAGRGALAARPAAGG